MIEYIENTGLLFSKSNFYQFGNISSEIGGVLINDRLSTEISINGLVPLETIPQITIVAQKEIISNSGDLFISGFQLRSDTGFYKINFQGDLWQDRIRSGEHIFFSHDTWTGLLTGFSGACQDSLSGDYVFLNGQKLISGEDYIEDAGGAFSYIGPDTGSTGTFFSMPKRNDTYFSGSYDISGDSFNKGCSVGFLNGVKLQNDSFLETSSNVSSLRSDTGFFFELTGVAEIQFSL